MLGVWLGLQDRNKSFGKVIIPVVPVLSDKATSVAVIKVCIAQQI